MPRPLFVNSYPDPTSRGATSPPLRPATRVFVVPFCHECGEIKAQVECKECCGFYCSPCELLLHDKQPLHSRLPVNSDQRQPKPHQAVEAQTQVKDASIPVLASSLPDQNPPSLSLDEESRLMFAESVPRPASDLHSAAIAGDLSFIQDFKGSIDEADDLGNTAFIYACREGHLEVARYLVNMRAANVSVLNLHGHSGIFLASQTNREQIVRWLVLEQKVDSYVREANLKRRTPLHMAAEGGALSVIRFFVEEYKMSPDLYTDNISPETNQTALFIAVERGHIEVVRYLIEQAKAAVFSLGDGSNSVVVRAASLGWMDILSYLVENHADKCGLRDMPGQKALEACMKANTHGDLASFILFARYLTDKGAPMGEITRQNWWALINSNPSACLPMLRWLVQDNHINLSHVLIGSQMTPLHLAAEAGLFDVVRFIVDAGVAVDITNQNGETALNLAAQKGHQEIVAYLQERFHGRGQQPVEASPNSFQDLQVAVSGCCIIS